MIPQEIRAKVASAAPKGNANIHRAVTQIAKLDFSALFDFDLRLKTDPALRERFIADPNGVVAQEAGFVVPEGFHGHYIDGDNQYYPSEGEAMAQLKAGKLGETWVRVEIRVAAGPGCYAFCGYCPTSPQ